MIPAFRIDPNFHGPTLCELMPILDDLSLDSDPLEVRWLGSVQDYLCLEKARFFPLTLVVSDLDVQEKTLWRLDGRLAITQAEVDTTMKTLFVKANQGEWRRRMTDLGYVRGTMLLCRIVADTLKSGAKIRATSVTVARECLLGHINPADADVLVRLRGRPR